MGKEVFGLRLGSIMPWATRDQGEGYQQPQTFKVEVAKHLCPKWDQNPIFLLEIGPIPFLGLDLIDPWSSFINCHAEVQSPKSQSQDQKDLG